MARAVVLGCAGPALGADEAAFLREADPLGFILFARNCESPAQVRALVTALRESVGRAEAPVLIDQEGGRVARLRPPHWRAAPAAACFGDLAATDPDRAARAAWINARLIAADLADLGITVNCAPVLDLARPETHAVIGDRALAGDPETVAALGRAVCAGLLAGGVLPVAKHLPGHGRARVDSHAALPIIEADAETLAGSDFVPFTALAEAAPWAMTAHAVYTALDPDRPATLSPGVIAGTLRERIGFSGVLISDDLSMKALSGDLATRAAEALAAGCDLVLHCNGDRAEMAAVVAGCAEVTPAARARLDRAEAARRAAVDALAEADRAALGQELEARLDRDR